jgi:hypothetical protein
MSDTTNLPSEGNKDPKDVLNLESLTDQNWLFIKHYLETADIKKAYDLAGYDGTAISSPYNIFKRLKPFIEEIGNLAVTSRLKLVADLNKVLSIPLVDKDNLTVSEWLRVRKFAASLTPETQSQPKLSLLIVNRYSTDKPNGPNIVDIGKTNTLPSDINPNDVIDADIVTNEE